MGIQLMTDIGSEITPSHSLSPVSISGSTDVNGSGVDRTGTSGDQEFMSGVLCLDVGVTTGSPTSFSIACRLQDSADNSSFADIASAAGGPYAVTAITAASSMALVSFNAKPLRRYVRAVVTPTFVAGSSPTIIGAAFIVLGGGQKKPTP